MSVSFSSQCKENVEKAEDHFSCETLTFTFEQVYFWCNLSLLDIKRKVKFWASGQTLTRGLAICYKYFKIPRIHRKDYFVLSSFRCVWL